MTETTYFGKIESTYRLSPNIVEVEFDCVAKHSAEMIFSQGWSAERKELRLAQILIEMPADQYRDLKKNRLEKSWFRLEKNRTPSLESQLFESFDWTFHTNEPSQEHFNIEPVRYQDPLAQKLTNMCLLDKERTASKHALRQTLIAICGKTPTNLCAKVLDVGQGSANAIMESSGQALLYFDVGGGFGPNKKTYPTHLRFCQSLPNPLVILSHWDKDHWASENEFKHNKWIAPFQQGLGPRHKALEVKLGNRLMLWPQHGPVSIKIGDIELRRARGKNRNNSGLQLLLRSHGKTIALTGDAQYSSLKLPRRLDALTIPHHGGARVGSPPKARSCGSIASISYGTNNTYRHPNQGTTQSHQHAGFQLRTTPANGHHFLCACIAQGCSNTQCNIC